MESLFFEDSFFCLFSFFVQWLKMFKNIFFATSRHCSKATWFIELLHCRIDGPEHELKQQLPENLDMTFHPQFVVLQGEMWTFSAFCCVYCSFLSGWVEPPQKNHLGADSMALYRHRVSKRKQLMPPQILPAPGLTQSSLRCSAPSSYARTSGKRDQLDNWQVVLWIKLFLKQTR